MIYDGCRGTAAEAVILGRAQKMHAPAVGLHREMYEILDKTDKSIDFELDALYYEKRKITVPYPAPYQAENASLALLAMEAVDPEHKIPCDVRLQAMADTHWQGRMETILPGVIVDGAHNEDGVREFVRTLNGVQEGRRIVLLFSAVVEKNYEQMIRTICETGRLSEVVATQIEGKRIVPAGELAGIFRKYTDAEVTAEEDIGKAFETALAKRGDGLLFCVGSLYLVGEIKALIEERNT